MSPNVGYMLETSEEEVGSRRHPPEITGTAAPVTNHLLVRRRFINAAITQIY